MYRLLWGIIALAMILSAPFLWERISVEEANDGYDIIMPHEDLHELKANGIPMDDVYSRLGGEQGIHGVSFEPLSVNDMREDYFLFDVLNSRNFMRETGVAYEDLPADDALYFLLHRPDHAYMEALIDVLNTELAVYGEEVTQTEVDGRAYLIVPRSSANIYSLPVTFDIEAIEETVRQDLDVVLRLENNFDTTNDAHPIFAQLADVSAMDGVSNILFSGDEVPGAEDPALITEMAERMNDLGLGVIMIENTDQAGMHTLVAGLERDPLRLHSMTLGQGQEDDLTHVYRASRAVHERNIQVLFVNILNKDFNESYDFGQAEPSLTLTSDYFLQGVHRRTEGTAGEAAPFTDFSQPWWQALITLLAAGAFTGLAASVVHRKLVLPVAAVSAVAFVLAGLSGISIVVKLIVLGLAVLAPVYALLRIDGVRSWKDVGLTFLQTIGITLTGAWFVVALLYGVEFSLHLDSFRGVQVLAIAPALAVTVWFVGYQWLKEPVKFWHLAVLAVVLGVAWFYLGRTGNQGIAIPYELEFRQFLENTLSVRPRTTEFLIGIPALTFALYMMKDGFRHARFILIPASLGLASMVGTFTHLHTPLLVSVQRTLFGLVIGIVIGFILIGLWHAGKTYLLPLIKRRLAS